MADGQGERMQSIGNLVPAILAGLRLRCPVCRQGPIFRSWSQIYERCPHCGTSLLSEAGEFVGAVVLYVLLGYFVVVGGLLLLEIYRHPPHETHAVLALAFALLVPFAAYRYVKGAWIGMVHAMRHQR